MSLVKRIKGLCDEKKVTFAEVERQIGISNGQIRRWDNVSPKSETLQKVADYFDVSTDYLLGRTEVKRNFDLTEKDEKDIQKELQKIINGLEGNSYAAFDGQSIDDMEEEDKELLIASLENTLRIAKKIAKQKYTPKKYR
ncbi:helix-turn-helix domain-containing protein [Bacillus safensis]|uniref:Transcriptional regulator n=1 Tax=Bacillus altitudinis TaxID=293387 RepID=A0A653R3C1_BACAB|nr:MULTISPECIES: helix-turn-helix transcriptional regulator [Bacillus]MBU8968004.1 helix-turn-helix domain-containing protein [Bacillus altitudinis]MCY7584590.1 helix-turn-helix domain-containing protein [Bacillus safensis]MCY7587461.1 helix-turn-helix domain-containing protein [Bacillus safensis]MCY7608989.1 helix-turn-helix domain-containing protein [Bacillus safensis]UTX10523.1 helix-turn-helix domain-containing protein [Bacillus altitudinis]